LLLLVTACNRGFEPRFVSHPAPDFTVNDKDRGAVTLSGLRGKVVILNFWATWCPPCIEELPSLVAMQQQLRSDVTVYAVSEDEDEAAYRKFVADYHVDQLYCVRDAEQVGSKLYGATGFPETYVIDRKGVIQRKVVGPVDWTDPQIIAYLQAVAKR
jgi:peroxiredoxin